MNLYTRCSELPLSKFIKIVCEGDLSHLVINPDKPYRGDPEAVWGEIFNEYLSLSGDETYKRMLYLANGINAIQYRIYAINRAIEELRTRRSEVLIAALKDVGYRVNDDTADAYLKSLDVIASKAASLGLDLKRKQVELDKLKAENKGQQPTEEYFLKILIDLQRYLGFYLDAEKITTAYFITVLNKMQQAARLQAMKNG